MTRFVSSLKAWTIRDFTVLEEKVNDEYVSDHYALLTHLALPVTYTVTFAPGAQGSGTQAPLTKQAGAALTLPQAVFTRAGYRQTGWATQENGALVYALGAAYTADANVTLYPVWTKDAAPLVITKQPTDQTIDEGQTATFSVAAAGDDIAYQWQINCNEGKGWVSLSGAVNAVYTTSAADKTCDGYQYRCHVTDAYNASLTSAVATLTVHAAPHARVTPLHPRCGLVCCCSLVQGCL